MDKTSTQRSQKRRALLCQAAIALGYESWYAYETAVINRFTAQLEGPSTNRKGHVTRGRLYKIGKVRLKKGSE
jgi:hypothetical protein